MMPWLALKSAEHDVAAARQTHLFPWFAKGSGRRFQNLSIDHLNSR